MGRGQRKRPKNLAVKLKEIRLQLGWTQEKLAKHLKTDSGSISRFENDQREPTVLELLKYARLAKTTMEVLVDDERKLK